MPTHTAVLRKDLSVELQERLDKASRVYIGDPRGGLDSFLRQGNVPAPTITIMSFVKSLLAYTDDEDYTCGGILTLLSARTPEGLAKLLFPRAQLDALLSKRPPGFPRELTAHNVNEVRARFLDDNPLAIMLVMVKENKFSMAERPRSIADFVLTVMIRDELETRSPELLAVVKQSFSRSKSDSKQQEPPTNEELEQTFEFVKSVKGLSSLVEDPEDVPRLYINNYHSVRWITAKSKEEFLKQMVQAGMKTENALKIHDCAERVDCWNEQLWLSLMQARRADFSIFATPQTIEQGIQESDVLPASRNNLTDIFGLVDKGCEECCSITSLSAYFADLMALLSKTAPTGQEPTSQDPKDAKSKSSLLNILSKRRPDLRKLQLTCANAQTLVPCVSLVNEVLESYIAHKNKADLSSPSNHADLIQAFNTPAGVEEDIVGEGHSEGPVYRPGNTNYEVYSKVISKQMFPFTCFPYDQARDVAVQYFNTFQLHLSDLSSAFQVPDLILQVVPMEKRGPATGDLQRSLTRGAVEVLERQMTADTIGLQQIEFAAITGESFFPVWFADILKGLSSSATSIATAYPENKQSQLWGYEDDDTMLDDIKGLGLSFVQGQLMRRSGLALQDILDLVSTQYFGHNLVITNASGSNLFTDFIGELRLLSNASNPPYEPLTPNLCRNLQSFMRLQAKLKWSTKDLDAAIYCLRKMEMESSPNFKTTDPSEVQSISVYVVKSIASIVKLSDLCGIEAASLLPLWGPIDSFGDNSLLRRKFLRSSLGDAFDVDGKYFKGVATKYTINSCTTSICASLRFPLRSFGELLKATHLTDADLDLDTFSTLYRYATITRILSVPAKECVPFFELFFTEGQEDPLASPKATLAAIEKWKMLLESGWTIKSLIRVLRRDVENRTPDSSGLKLTAAILEGAKELRKSLSSLFTGAIPTSGDVVECATRTFDPATAKMIVDFVEGTQVQSATILLESKENLQNLMDRCKNWPKKLSMIPAIDKGVYRAELRLSGVLSKEERLRITDGSDELPAVNSTIQSLVASSLLPQSIIASRFKDNSESRETLADNILLQDWASTLLSEDESNSEAGSIQTELQLRARRTAFVNLAAPTVIQDLLRTLIVNTVKDFMPDVDMSMILSMISQVVMVPTKDNTGTESAMTALQLLTEPSDDVMTAKTLDAYFTPNSTDDFTLLYNGSPISAPKLTVNGLEMSFDAASKTWNPFCMTGGQPYLLQGDFPVLRLSWSTPKSMITAFTEKMLLPSTVTQRAALIHDAMSRVLCVFQTLELTTTELEYMLQQVQTNGSMLAIDLNAPKLEDLVRLQNYRRLRESSNDKNSKISLIGLFSWLSSTPAANVKTIAGRIALSTGWNEMVVESLLKEKFPGYADADLVTTLRDFNTILTLNTMVLFYERLGGVSDISSKPPLADIFILARPPFKFTIEDAYVQAAQTLQSRLSGSQRAAADEALLENQREALVNYLLQQKYIKEMGIWDADGMFQHFLIDVQMGPQLRTSRIKQAISVVQFFAQRCLLGLEKGVSKAALQREQWDWMQQYTLWEAHRKIFLYPENWIDPTLRDDKSQLFVQLEAGIMQKDLTIRTFLQAVQTYVYGLDEISTLEIVAYLHEPQLQAADIFHFFGRTRAAPYTFYYRTLTVMKPSYDIFWQPWTKIEMDIPSVETEWDGKRLETTGSYLLPILIGGRLYLFMPSIVPKTLASNATLAGASGKDTFSDLGSKSVKTADPSRIWEITMGWTEFVKGSWSPKRISPGCLSIDSQISSSKLRVDPVFINSKLKLRVSYSVANQTQSTTIGSFDFCEDQMSAVSISQEITANPFPTYFQKASNKGFTPPALLSFSSTITNNALLWVPEALPRNEEITWTLSKIPQRVIGLVLSTKQSDGTNTSYFNMPRTDLIPAKDGRQWDTNTLKNNMELVLLDHIFSSQFMQATSDRVDPLRRLYKYMAQLPSENLRESYGAGSHGVWYHELGRPSALYNWEIGLHAVLLAVDRFFSTQQFEEALQVARLVFDPSVDLDVETTGKKRYQSCWLFPPFQEMAQRMAATGEDSFDPLDLTNLRGEIELAIKERRSYGSIVHAAARGRPVSYMKWIVMKYAEILIAIGDIHFRRGTLEALPLATQRYIEASHLLGTAPPKVPDLAKRKARASMTFEQLREQDISFDMVTFELGLPFSAKLKKGGAERTDRDPKKENVVCFLRTDYFCIPTNPRFKQMHNLVHERLFNIRNSFDIQGRPVVYALREPPIDPGALIALSKGGAGMSDILSMVMGEGEGPIPRRRFETMLSRALELCTELRSLGERLISAIEKKEGESFSALSARHSAIIQKMMLDIKGIQLEEAQATVESLLINRSALELQLNYYLKLIGEDPETKIPKPKDDWVDIMQDIETPTQDDLRMSSNEKKEMDLALAGSVLNGVAAGLDGLVAPFCAIPQIETYTAPLGVGVSVAAGGSQISSALAAVSSAMKMSAQVIAEEAARSGRKARLIAQLQERRLQANMRAREMKSIDKEVEIQNIRVRAVKKEIALQESDLEEATQTEMWYRTKYTNEQLYGWMEKSLRNLYFQAYMLTMTMASRAESSFQFEQGRKTSIIRPGGYWDAGRDGLLAADHLYLDLKRLEAAHLEGSSADYEISKTVSLKQIDPMALMRLRITGTTDFSLGELLYDMDFPGHYMRRIKSVAVSIPAALGNEHRGVNATLTLLTHKYRVTQNVGGAEDYVSSQGPGSEAFRTDRLPISSIAVSSGSLDSGVFNLDFSGSRYIPFEGAGAISKWRLELPTAVRKFDYESISDVLLHVNYTSYEGGAMLKSAANGAVVNAAKAVEDKGQNNGFWTLLDLKNEFPNEWQSFSTKLLQKKTTAGEDITMNLGDLKNRLPFWPRRQTSLEVRAVTMMSHGQKVLNGLGIPALAEDPKWVGGVIGDIFTRSCVVTERNFNWAIKADGFPEDKEKTVENVYLLVQYVFVGGKTS